jgi:SAM-dependent methyltransferase
MKIIIKKVVYVFNYLFFDPFLLFNKWRAIPSFLLNIFLYYKKNKRPNFKIEFSELFCVTYEKYNSAGVMKGHYFFQDIWAANKIFRSNVNLHYDIASRIDGFVAHILPFTNVKYVDIRNANSTLPNLEFIQGSILNLPFSDNSIKSLSCLHVIEHIGLGRYGDDIDPFGYEKASKELIRVLSPGGKLYIGTPIGKERLCFDAHRVFNVDTILNLFSELELIEFSAVDDLGDRIIHNADTLLSKNYNYGCGLFEFRKP